MTLHALNGKGKRSAGTRRVGLFGLLGSGNIGNDASMESVLGYLRDHHPDLPVDAMCMGPDRLRREYGIDSIPLQWYRRHDGSVSGVTAIALKVAGKGLDVFRTANWVRQHDVVIVPGMGVLEASLPLRATGFPFAMFLMGAFGKLFRAKVALVSVGATVTKQRGIRLLQNSAARFAFYRSYRDDISRDAMTERGVDTTHDYVYPDLAFSLPITPGDPGDSMTVGVGVMEYYGTNDDRRNAEEIHASYLATMKYFVRWLVDNGHNVRLFMGDKCDEGTVQEIIADVRQQRPHLDPARVTAEPIASFTDLVRAMEPVGTVVATRFHNVLCALKLAKPTISLGYAEKNSALMTNMGLTEFCQSANSLDADLLVEQFTKLEKFSPELRRTMLERSTANARLLDEQFARLSEVLFPAGNRARAEAGTEPGRSGIH
jgi:polysaccharide pyruvyl transferase WcaK-like protein